MTMAQLRHFKEWLNGGRSYPKLIPDVAPENRLTDEELHREIEVKCAGMLWWIASRWWSKFRELDREELHQEAVLGCYDARRIFDKSRGLKFNTYARRWANRRVQRFIVRETKNGGILPGHSDRITPIDMKSLQSVRYRTPEGPTLLGETIPDHRLLVPSGYLTDEFWERAAKLLVGRQFEVLSLRYREGLTMRQAAVRMGVGCSRVGQIEEKALERLMKCRELMRILEDAN